MEVYPPSKMEIFWNIIRYSSMAIRCSALALLSPATYIAIHIGLIKQPLLHNLNPEMYLKRSCFCKKNRVLFLTWRTLTDIPVSTLKYPRVIYTRGHGYVFVSSDFLYIGSREAIDVVLHRLVRKGIIRRLARGLYDFPEKHPVLGTLQPSAEKIAAALAGRDCTRLQPTEAYAANLLGLSEQIPAKVVFLTDGPSRTLKIGRITIQLRQTTAKKMAVVDG